MKDKQPEKKKKHSFLPVILILALVAVGATAAAVGLSQREKPESKPEPETSQESDSGLKEGQVVHNGVTYEYNKNLETLLFLGVDKRESEFDEHATGEGGQADCILLFILDSGQQTVRILQISRDTMVDLDIYDANGEKFGTEKGQITLQYAYGDGKQRSCWLMEQAVSKLLYGVEMDGYFAMNLEGFSKATDLVGGVTLTVPEDYTAIDPAFQKGATVTMDGELARKYVQTRDITVLGSNNDRMERQAQFLEALAQKMTQDGGNAVSYTRLFTELQDHIVTDMNADDLASLSDYEFTETIKAPGETRAGEEHDEFYTDEEALYELILELFYVPVQQS